MICRFSAVTERLEMMASVSMGSIELRKLPVLTKRAPALPWVMTRIREPMIPSEPMVALQSVLMNCCTLFLNDHINLNG